MKLIADRRRRFRGRAARAGHDRYWITEAAAFVMASWHAYRSAERTTFVFVAARHHARQELVEEAFELDKAPRRLRSFLEKHPRREWDLFWSPAAFSKPKRVRSALMSTPYGWAKLNDWRGCRPAPSIVWITSPRNYEALWRWSKFQTPGKAEALCRSMAKHFKGDSRASNPLTWLRIPHTYNHETTPRSEVDVVWFDQSAQRRPTTRRNKPPRRARRPANPFIHGRYTVAEKYRERMRWQSFNLIRHRRVRRRDHARCVQTIITDLFRAGERRHEIAAAVWRSPYFVAKHGQSLEALDRVVERRLNRLKRIRRRRA